MDRLTDEQRALAADHFGLARRIANEMAPRLPGRADEVTSAAMLGLCKAAASFDPGAGVRFATWAWRKIAFEVMHAVRAETRTRRYARTVSLVDDEGRCLLPVVAADRRACPLGAVDDADAAEALVRLFPCGARELARAFYVAGRTQQAIAADLGLVHSGVSQKLRAAIEIIRTERGM